VPVGDKQCCPDILTGQHGNTSFRHGYNLTCVNIQPD
jgi:hypothetical protein